MSCIFKISSPDINVTNVTYVTDVINKFYKLYKRKYPNICNSLTLKEVIHIVMDNSNSNIVKNDNNIVKAFNDNYKCCCRYMETMKWYKFIDYLFMTLIRAKMTRPRVFPSSVFSCMKERKHYTTDIVRLCYEKKIPKEVTTTILKYLTYYAS